MTCPHYYHARYPFARFFLAPDKGAEGGRAPTQKQRLDDLVADTDARYGAGTAERIFAAVPSPEGCQGLPIKARITALQSFLGEDTSEEKKEGEEDTQKDEKKDKPKKDDKKDEKDEGAEEEDEETKAAAHQFWRKYQNASASTRSAMLREHGPLLTRVARIVDSSKSRPSSSAAKAQADAKALWENYCSASPVEKSRMCAQYGPQLEAAAKIADGAR